MFHVKHNKGENISRETKHMQAVTLCICAERLSATNS
nr:MAG TPA: hypothetical protein [Caudoviricetes sp.]